MLIIVGNLMNSDECGGIQFFHCLNALVRQFISSVAMAMYTVSLTIVLWNVERLDGVLQVQEDIQELEDFKAQVDKLNAHDFQEDGNSSISMIQCVERELSEQMKLVGTFFNRAFGVAVGIESYQELADLLESALEKEQQPITKSLGGRTMPSSLEECEEHEASEKGPLLANGIAEP